MFVMETVAAVPTLCCVLQSCAACGRNFNVAIKRRQCSNWYVMMIAGLRVDPCEMVCVALPQHSDGVFSVCARHYQSEAMR